MTTPAYDARYFESGRHEKPDALLREVYLPLVSEHLDAAASRALEIGCATGGLASALSHRVPLVAGIDLAELAVQRAAVRPTTGCLHVLQANGMALPFTDNSFDVVIALDVIEHVDAPIVLLREARRVMTHGGVLVLTTPNLSSALRFVQGRRWHGFSDPTHVQLFGPAALRWLFVAAGFEVVGLHTPYLPLRRRLPRSLVAVLERTGTGGQIVAVARRPR